MASAANYQASATLTPCSSLIDKELPHKTAVEDPATEQLAFALFEEKVLKRLEHVVRLYNAGKPLFPRALLEDLDRQIEEGREEIRIKDFDDVVSTYSRSVPAVCLDLATTYCIGYSSIQVLTHIHPSCATMMFKDPPPVSILYTRHPEVAEGNIEMLGPVFVKMRERWQESETCQELVSHLTTLRFSLPIHKIVAFGLGTLGKTQNGRFSTRSHVQHAAVETMATILAKSGVSGGKRIDCYFQDPWYDENDVRFLHSIGFQPLNDPKGFLEIDEHTLVFSVSPNVPVKQIVADLQWPGAMIWNTVCGEEERKQWKRRLRNGEEFWLGPLATDPDSDRVCEMITHYQKFALHDPKDYFGDLSIYVRH
ncbi:SRR1 family protein [Aspergillus brunneoviolaceus CBS 621.78]|uniref:Uncharacterized protein n=1 Tax=Aspergillus brunneoviolaceus CBS 621.78 TaxID=1450534 RepID=A0ACD1GI58_9EURO|nr:hypothetical protein BO95DRAFT_355994 [Aspergillus brunneoviolaceus CBS 621.78]RAH48862.1 hypothetical protein BO95DRAFT_355994 [Aspergillus brunneoviolaceus CBS 621.78]